MKTMIKILIILQCISCQRRSDYNEIVKSNDVDAILKQAQSVSIEDEESRLNQSLLFWEDKRQSDPDGFIYHEKIADIYHDLFEIGGNHQHLKASNNSLQSAANCTAGKRRASNLLRLSVNSIQQHDFNAAYRLAEEALLTAGLQADASLILFDAAMEVGQFKIAQNVINNYENVTSFDYLIRKAKHEDHLGRLDQAVAFMELALGQSHKSEKEKWIWTKCALGQMYGHQGKIAQSYDAFIEVLCVDFRNRAALEGIAWIAFSHDANFELSEKIYTALSSWTESPEYDLNLADISLLLGDKEQALAYQMNFFDHIVESDYANLYTPHLIELNLDRKVNIEESYQMAHSEVLNRPTPASYALYARTLLARGDQKAAVETIRNHVYGKTFEPKVLFHCLKIFHECREARESQVLISELLDSAFELGPKRINEIKTEVLSI